MYPIKKVLVALDFSELDELLIQFAAFITRSSQAEKVYFVNVVRNLNVPDEILKEFPDMVDKALNERKAQVQKQIDKYFRDYSDVKIQLVVKDGQPARKILEMCKDSNIDLVVAGRKITLEGSGVLVQRLARKVSCNLLIVPEVSNTEIKKLLIPSDFSEFSKLAIENGVNLAERNASGIQLLVQNVYSVPVGYHYTGKSYEEFAEVMKKHAKRNFQKFLRSIDLHGQKVKEIYTLTEDDSLVNRIMETAEKQQVDGIVIGAKGRTAATAIFLGSIAERIIQKNNRFPLLIVRPKGQNAGWMDFLLDI